MSLVQRKSILSFRGAKSATQAVAIQKKVLPQSKKEDALHLAISTVYEFDILLSWNFKHLANINKQILINSINEKEFYQKRINILSPLEVVYDE